jgi:hypothetical protein
VDAGFYSQTSGAWSSNSVAFEPCRSCSGTGVYDSEADALRAQLAEARARYHTDVDGAISARLAAEDAFREQEQYARDRFALFDISHKDTVHGLLDIARRALVTTKEPTDD